MMTDKMAQIKAKMQAGDVQGAAAELKALLAAEPDNAEAQMLYGTCCHLLGDDKTFGEIHDALAPKMERETDEVKLSLWRRYCGEVASSRKEALVRNMQYAEAGVVLMEWLTIAGLIGAALCVAAWLFGRDILNTFKYGGPTMNAPVRASATQERVVVGNACKQFRQSSVRTRVDTETDGKRDH